MFIISLLTQTSILTYILWILAAIIPAAVLFIITYASDRVEKESKRMLWSLIGLGALAAIAALVEELLGLFVLGLLLPETSLLYQILEYYVFVALAEELAKYAAVRIRTRKSREFDWMYDGIVYAVFVSLGFALLENIFYVLEGGLAIAVLRAFTAVPAHACFGVFMGVFHSFGREALVRREHGLGRLCRVCAILIPTLIHGTYDFIASMDNEWNSVLFIIWFAILVAISIITVVHMSKNDRRIGYGHMQTQVRKAPPRVR